MFRVRLIFLPQSTHVVQSTGSALVSSSKVIGIVGVVACSSHGHVQQTCFPTGLAGS